MKDCTKLQAYHEKNKANNIQEEQDDEFVLSVTSPNEIEHDEYILSIVIEEMLFGMESDISDWTLDSGATSHITGKKELFCELSPIDEKKIKVANGYKLDIVGNGSIKIQFKNEKGDISIAKLTDVLYVPAIKANFVSIQKLTTKGFEVRFSTKQSMERF